jgi:hypothetical protein
MVKRSVILLAERERSFGGGREEKTIDHGRTELV